MTLDDLALALEKHLNIDGGIYFSHIENPAQLILPDGGVRFTDAASFLFDILEFSIQKSPKDMERFKSKLKDVMLTRLEVEIGDTLATSTFFIGLQLINTDWHFDAMPVLGDKLHLKNPGVMLGRVGPDSDWEFGLSGTLSVWDQDFDVSCEWPSKRLSARYTSKGIEISNLLSAAGLPAAAISGTAHEIELSADLTYKTYSATMALEGVEFGGLHAFDKLRLEVEHGGEHTNGTLSATVHPIPGLPIDLTATIGDEGMTLRGAAHPDPKNLPKLGHAAQTLVGKATTLELPEITNRVVLTKLSVEFNIPSKPKDSNDPKPNPTTSTYTLEAGIADSDGTMSHNGIRIGVDVKKSTGSKTTIDAHLLFGDEEFHIEKQTAGAGEDAPKLLAATYVPTPPKKFKLKDDLVAHLTHRADVLNLMPSLEISLKAVTLAQVTPRTVEDTTSTDETAKVKKIRALGLSMDLDAGLNLTALPLIGSAVSALGLSENVGVDGLKIAISNGAMDLSVLQALNAALPEAARLPEPAPKDDAGNASDDDDESDKKKPGLNKGFTVAGKISTGLSEIALMTGSPDEAEADEVPPSPEPDALPPDPNATSGITTPSDGAAWFKIEKKLGPLYLHRLGFSYRKGELWVFPEADFTVSGLTISLEGFAISTPLDAFHPSFHLQGLALDFKNGPMEIGGAFMRVEGKLGGKPYEEYCGSLVIKTEAMSLAAIGSYAHLDSGPSMFVYLDLKYPLGGPPFFFVTGLAGGFGYNRRLIIPDIHQLAKFPFIKLAMDNQPAPKEPVAKSGKAGQSVEQVQSSIGSILTSMHTFVPPEVGSNWFAAGVHFTSFEIVDGFVLLTVEFGNEFELHVLGKASFSFPPKASDAETETPLIKIDVLVEASYLPAKGTVEMQAIIADGSYVFEPECHLTGGLAFKTWFSGPMKDEFVFTLGGYHPKFKPPAGYPNVDRLGFNWQRSSALSIKGGMYFAITGHVLMAGGYLKAVYESGCLKAWITVTADFLVEYKPFHYDAEMSVEIGAQVTIHFFGTHHMSVTLGANLHIWGPSFAGRASFDIWVASFAVSFGDSGKKPPRIPWHQFQGSFLPKDHSKIVGLQAIEGLVEELSHLKMVDFDVAPTGHAEDIHWMVNPKEFKFCLTLTAPDTSLAADGAATSVHAGIPSMGLTSGEFRASHSLRIFLGEGKKTIEVTHDDFTMIPIVGRAPGGLWGEPGDAKVDGDTTIPGTVRQFEISSSAKADGGAPLKVEKRSLAFDTESLEDAFAWREPQTDAANWQTLGDVWASKNAATTFDKRAAKTTKRDALFAQFLPKGDLTGMTGAAQASDLLVRAAGDVK